MPDLRLFNCVIELTAFGRWRENEIKILHNFHGNISKSSHGMSIPMSNTNIQ